MLLAPLTCVANDPVSICLKVLPALLQLNGPCEAFAAQPDDETATAFCQRLAELVEQLLGRRLAPAIAAAEPEHVGQLIKLAVTLMQHRDMAVAERVLPFWNSLTDYDTGDAWNASVFLPITQMIVGAAAFPPDFTGWDSSVVDEDEFARFRMNLVVVYGARFRQKCTLKDAIGSRTCSLEVSIHATKWQSARMTTTSHHYHRKLCRSTEGQ
jgi:hypothetical protein